MLQRAAQERLAGVTMAPELEELVALICTEALVAEHRADLAITACARALAVFYGRLEVNENDIHEAAAKPCQTAG